MTIDCNELTSWKIEFYTFDSFAVQLRRFIKNYMRNLKSSLWSTKSTSAMFRKRASHTNAVKID